jgi:hypothetical protein
MVSDTGRTNPLPVVLSDESRPFGCVSQRTCTSCGAVVSDPICMCVGIFDCPRCGAHNNQSILGSGGQQPPIKFLSVSDNFPDDLGEIISNLTLKEAVDLLLYLKSKECTR